MKIKAALITAMTWVLVLVFFFPVLWMFLNAFKSENDASLIPPKFLFTPTLEGFQLAWDRGMATYMANSLFASVGATLLILLLAVPGAYALSIRPVKKTQDTLFFFISTRFLPVAAVILPLYMIFKSLGVLDNIIALGFVYAAINLPIAIWMMRSFFLEVPREIVEAAQLDGAGLYKELTKVVLPLVLPGIAAVGLIVFIFSWNEYFLATLLTTSDAKTTPPFLASFVDGRGLFLGAISAAASLATLPVIIAGWVAQKQLVRGLAMGAVK